MRLVGARANSALSGLDRLPGVVNYFHGSDPAQWHTGIPTFSKIQYKAGIYKNIGWHTFRHSFGTLLKANGEDVKTVQELLRHANRRITLDVYTQAVTSHKRAAQSKVVSMMVADVGQNGGSSYPRTGA